MSTMTWTGKTSGGKPGKIKFESYKNTLQLIYDLSIAADNKFNQELVLKELKYGILKYAHVKSKPTSTTTSQSPSPVPTVLSTGSEHSTNSLIDIESALTVHETAAHQLSQFQKNPQNPHPQHPYQSHTHQQYQEPKHSFTGHHQQYPSNDPHYWSQNPYVPYNNYTYTTL